MNNLIKLYDEMQKLTWSRCLKQECNFGCCNPRQCLDVAEYALSRYGVDLHYKPGQTFIIESSGCWVPPYLRPVCTVHQCKAEFLGNEYWDLRLKITELEVEAGCLNY